MSSWNNTHLTLGNFNKALTILLTVIGVLNTIRTTLDYSFKYNWTLEAAFSTKFSGRHLFLAPV